MPPAYTGPPTLAPTPNPMDAFTAALSAAIDKQTAALTAQKEASDAANLASLPQIDSESARAAADNRRRRLSAGSNFGIGLPSLLGSPPIGYRMLAGE